MPLERMGAQSVPMSRVKPTVIGGVCEYCGTVDNQQPPEVQYQLCQHFRDLRAQGMEILQCSYCPASSNPIDVIKKGRIHVHEHPDKPNVWIAVCDSYNCTLAHEKRFNRATS